MLKSLVMLYSYPSRDIQGLETEVPNPSRISGGRRPADRWLVETVRWTPCSPLLQLQRPLCLLYSGLFYPKTELTAEFSHRHH